MQQQQPGTVTHSHTSSLATDLQTFV